MSPIEGAAAVVIGYAWQWARAPKRIPNWASYIAFGVIVAGTWYLVTPTADAMIRENWRNAIAAMLMFGMAARGTASVASEVKAAPPTDSL